ncbi:MAG: hypothetical protein LBH04_05840 [Tannerellaceae bacterium]|jgi:hypothetical protein|nr:hypothetical protein [Tannerellaceae bacterium]
MSKPLSAALLILFLHASRTDAQTTIGLNSEPARAALLDIKTLEPSTPSTVTDDSNITSERGGLLLPRVMLDEATTLSPLIPITDPDWINHSTTRIKELHTGLTVYNLAGKASLKPGICTWDGTLWRSTGPNSISAGEGLSLSSESIRLGGKLTRPLFIDMETFPLNILGSGMTTLSASVHLSAPLQYTNGHPAKGKLLMSDAAGNAVWKENITSPPMTPTGVMSSKGASGKISTYKNKWINTNAYIQIPPGRWMIMVTMLIPVKGGNSNDRIWLESSFVKEDKTSIDPSDFVGSSSSISGVLSNGYNILTGYVVMDNKSKGTKKFYYCAGQCKMLNGSTGNIEFDKIGATAWGENSIVAFALVE